MGHPAFRVVADDDLESAIFAYIGQLKRRQVVPTNRIVKALKTDFPDAGLSGEQLASLVKRAAISDGLVPVFDPELPPTPIGNRFSAL